MWMERLFGGNPIGIIIRLVIISIVVGVVLSALQIRPDNLLYHLKILIERIYNLGFGAVESLAEYFIVGAIVVIPIWLIARLIKGMRKSDKQNN